MWSDYLPNVLSARGPYTKRKMPYQYCKLLKKSMVLFS